MVDGKIKESMTIFIRSRRLLEKCSLTNNLWSLANLKCANVRYAFDYA